MKLTFINHSSFAVEHDGIFMVIDPWLEGRVFNNGWDLISETKFGFEDFSKVTHIWFSHEHPDHFFPPNINRIPEEYRKRITVLFQQTVDKRVVNYCKKVGFGNVVEMLPDTFIDLTPDFKVMCELYQEGDSWLFIKSKDYTIFNTNDCGIRDKHDAEVIRKKIGNVDLLLTQFSYAYWAGNKDQHLLRRKIADEKLEGLKLQVDIFKPRFVVPIASFVWFCHEENFYLNDEINRPQKVVDFIKNRTDAKPVMLYSGEEYWPDKDHDSAKSISKYNEDFERILNKKELVKTVPVGQEELKQQAKTFVANLKHKFGMWSGLLTPSKIWITDYKQAYELSLTSGLKESAHLESQCDASLSSESLAFNFKFPWGNDTLGINGRYQRPEKGNYSRFYNFFRYNQLDSRGIKIGLGYFSDMAWRKVKVKLGLQKI